MIRIFTIVFLLTPLLTLNAQHLAVASAKYSEFNNAPVSPLLIQSYGQPYSFRPMKSTFRIPGEKQKKIGSTMMALGGAMIIGGLVMYSRSDKTPTKDSVLNNYNQWEVYDVYDAKLVGGILLMVAGTGVTVPGVLIWRKGVRRYNEYMLEQQRLSLYYHGTGATISYRF